MGGMSGWRCFGADVMAHPVRHSDDDDRLAMADVMITTSRHQSGSSMDQAQVLTHQKSAYPFRRFRELDASAINVELQMHTVWTDGKATAKAVAREARERGLETIAFTEHVRRDTDWLAAFVDEIRDIAAGLPDMTILAGLEAKILNTDGDFDAAAEHLALSDIVLGSVHRFPDGRGGYLDFAKLDPTAFAWIEAELSLALLRHAPIDVLAHPAGMYQRRLQKPFPEELYQRLFQAALDRDIAIEINSSYLIDPDRFLRLLEAQNPYVSIGSDVHELDHVGRCRDLLMSHFGW